VASVDGVGPVARAIDSFARATDGFFRDPNTGDVVLVQRPNMQMKALGVTLALGRVFRSVGLLDPGDPGDVLLERTAMGMLMWWSVDQMRHGTTRYLKTVGAVTLVGAVARSVLADPVHGLAALRDRRDGAVERA
jgi:hypothetical protein